VGLLDRNVSSVAKGYEKKNRDRICRSDKNLKTLKHNSQPRGKNTKTEFPD
jgi:hypothetical protein